MKRSTLVLVVALALVGVVAAIAASLLHDGLSARATPNKLEITIARNARHLAIPSAARQAQNPLLASPEDLRDARLHFADHCAICHGNDGSAKPLMRPPLYPNPPDPRLPHTQ